MYQENDVSSKIAAYTVVGANQLILKVPDWIWLQAQFQTHRTRGKKENSGIQTHAIALISLIPLRLLVSKFFALLWFFSVHYLF